MDMNIHFHFKLKLKIGGGGVSFWRLELGGNLPTEKLHYKGEPNRSRVQQDLSAKIDTHTHVLLLFYNFYISINHKTSQWINICNRTGPWRFYWRCCA